MRFNVYEMPPSSWSMFITFGVLFLYENQYCFVYRQAPCVGSEESKLDLFIFFLVYFKRFQVQLKNHRCSFFTRFLFNSTSFEFYAINSVVLVTFG